MGERGGGDGVRGERRMEWEREERGMEREKRGRGERDGWAREEGSVNVYIGQNTHRTTKNIQRKYTTFYLEMSFLVLDVCDSDGDRIRSVLSRQNSLFGFLTLYPYWYSFDLLQWVHTAFDDLSPK